MRSPTTGSVTPAHYGFWTALTERSCVRHTALEDPGAGLHVPGPFSFRQPLPIAGIGGTSTPPRNDHLEASSSRDRHPALDRVDRLDVLKRDCGGSSNEQAGAD